jgi:hypothetical protein
VQALPGRILQSAYLFHERQQQVPGRVVLRPGPLCGEAAEGTAQLLQAHVGELPASVRARCRRPKNILRFHKLFEAVTKGLAVVCRYK